MTSQPQSQAQFLITGPSPCPYLPDRHERKVFTRLSNPKAMVMHDALMWSGFRRSQDHVYKPACGGCASCISVRIEAQAFQWSRSFRRVWRRNEDLIARQCDPRGQDDRYELFKRYLEARHDDGGMTAMDQTEFRAMLEGSPVDTLIVDYHDREDRLVACALTDRLRDGFSMVYTFFDPALADRSLGVYVILDHVRRTVARGGSHLYLGYWVAGSRKMAYKRRFKPLEAFIAGGWIPLDKR